MNWEAISAIADVVGVVAVIVTVIYLAMQIKQSTRSIQGATEQTLMTQEMDLYALIAQHANIYRRGCEDLNTLDVDEAVIYENLLFAQMSQIYSGWVQYHRNLIPESVWRAYVNGLVQELKNPGYRAKWLEVENTYPVEFHTMVRSEAGMTARE